MLTREGFFFSAGCRGFSLMNYYLTDPEILPKLTEGEILLTEPVLRPEDDGETVLRFLKDLGFETLFHRERFVRQEEMSSGRQEEAAGAEERENVTAARNDMSGYRSGIAELPGFGDDFSEAGGEAAGGRIRVCRAEPGDDQGVYDLLTSCFDPQTACLPQRQEIKGIIAEGRIICAKGVSEEIEGVLHFKHGKKSSEIRHLATGRKGCGDRDWPRGCCISISALRSERPLWSGRAGTTNRRWSFIERAVIVPTDGRRRYCGEKKGNRSWIN